MKSKIIYRLTIDDIQTVAKESFGRELTAEELKTITDSIGDKISWYDIISDSIIEKLEIQEIGS